MMARIFFAASLLGAFAACGTDGGSVSTDMDDIEARGFESIIGDGGFDIYFMQAERTSVEVRGGDVSRVKARSDGKALRFYAEGGRHDGGDNVDIYVTSPVLRGITMNGTGDFESESPVRTDGMEIRVNGEGDVMLRSLACDECVAKAAGSGDIDIDRISASHLVAETSGEGDIDLQNADIGRAECTIRGEGDIDIDGHVGHCDKDIQGTGVVDINP